MIQGSSMRSMAVGSGHVGGVVQRHRNPIAAVHAIDDAGRGGDEVEVELAAQPLQDDFEVQQAKEAAAVAEPDGGRGLGLMGEARVVEAELAETIAQPPEIVGIGRKQAAEDHRLAGFEAGQRLRGGAPVLGDGIADAGLGHLFDAGGKEADLARAQGLDRLGLGHKGADPLDGVHRAGGHHAHPHPLPYGALAYPYQNDDAEVGVVPAVDQKRLERRILVSGGRGHAPHKCLQHLVDAGAGLGPRSGAHRRHRAQLPR